MPSEVRSREGMLLWVSSGRIWLWTWEFVVWALQYLPMLQEGRWPACPIETGYYDASLAARPVHTEASFVKPVNVHAEITWRLAQCWNKDGKSDGSMAIQLYSFGQTPQGLAKEFHLTWWDVMLRADKAIGYSTGKDRREITYQEWH